MVTLETFQQKTDGVVETKGNSVCIKCQKPIENGVLKL